MSQYNTESDGSKDDIVIKDVWINSSPEIRSLGDDWTVTIDTSDTIGIFAEEIDTLTLDNVLWENYMPDPAKLKRMCEQYPALAKAYENFKTVYSMVEQDWEGNYEDDDDELFF